MTTSPSPELDPRSLAEALSYYQSWLAFRQRYLRLPGVQAAVYAGDEVAMSRAYGHADVEQSVSLTPQHLFRIASQSKTFTATAVFQLVERGVVRLDDTAGTWVRELAAAGSPLAAATVRELLSHAAGVYRDSSDGDFWQLWRPFPDRARLLEIVCAPESAVLPRNKRFKYSNIGFGLLGLIIEAAAGKEYADVVGSSIIGPLGLHDTGPELEQRRAGDYARGYTALSYADHRVPIDHVDTGALAPATGAYATATDLVTYFSAHFLGDDRLLTDESKRLMQQALWRTGEDDRHYAHGLGVTTVGERTMIGHGGGYPGHATYSLADPLGRIVVSVLTNAIDGGPEPLASAGVRLIDLACGEARPDDPDDTATPDLERYTGRFASLWTVADVVVLGGRLYMIAPAQEDPTKEPVELEVVSDTELEITESPGYASYGERLVYHFDSDGRVRDLRGPSATTLTPLEDFSLGDEVHLP
ncbi:MAG: serine hydrolase domain-containing protein [Nocardioidaceae bacterium]